MVVYLLIPTSNHNYIFSVVHASQVVYLLIPTSNHNFISSLSSSSEVVYLLIPTSNHNLGSFLIFGMSVVYLLIPTSNHNLFTLYSLIFSLYIFWFLHQTTTTQEIPLIWIRCISFDSYIKPQPSRNKVIFLSVVYLLIPTSNHNSQLNGYADG